ncbi:alkane hydroxylase MAH1 [Gossypium hirsutum]|uniref:Alkane hydroxylase MAH1 n=1 Tax=Gossypium hirsutum TaxID=3635 RepID=A0ABM2YND4_GOSHI|nr:alkane hydroxylase MAH1-like [Gossypium hirsutum]
MAFQSFLQVCFLALISFLFLYRLMRYKNGCPKSSAGIVELLLNVHRVHDWCTETLESCKGTFVLEGPWFAKMNLVATCDPANAHYVMSSNFDNFPKGPEYKQMFDILGDGIFNSDLDLWKNQRIAAQGFMRHHLFHQFLLRTSRDKVEMGLMPIIDHAAKHGLVINLEDIFQRFTFDSACILVTGSDPSSLSLELPQVLFSKAVHDGEQAIFYRHVKPRSFTKLQKWLNIGQEGKYKKASKVVDDVLSEYICQKRKEVNKLNQQLVSKDVLERHRSEYDNCCDGHDEHCSYLVHLAGFQASNSGNKIIEELESKIPIGETKWRLLFNVDEVKNLVYLHGALCEALRLYPPVPFNHKEPVKPDILPSGHPVHPKTKILFSVYSMGRMKSIWGEDCYEFKPERWINERGEIKHESSYEFLSFGAGPRICLGKETSFIQMKAVASALIYNDRIHVMEETPVVSAVSVVLHTENGLMTRISKRWE